MSIRKEEIVLSLFADDMIVHVQSKRKTRNYKTPRGEHRQNTLRHTSQQDPL